MRNKLKQKFFKLNANSTLIMRLNLHLSKTCEYEESLFEFVFFNCCPKVKVFIVWPTLKVSYSQSQCPQSNFHSYTEIYTKPKSLGIGSMISGWPNYFSHIFRPKVITNSIFHSVEYSAFISKQHLSIEWMKRQFFRQSLLQTSLDLQNGTSILAGQFPKLSEYCQTPLK